MEESMARIPLLNEDDEATPPEARQILGGMKTAGGLVNLYRALAHHPEALQAFRALGGAVYGRGSKVTRKQAELAYTTATTVNDCYY
jgi:alkylhydroperoxidase family enzyme